MGSDLSIILTWKAQTHTSTKPDWVVELANKRIKKLKMKMKKKSEMMNSGALKIIGTNPLKGSTRI